MGWAGSSGGGGGVTRTDPAGHHDAGERAREGGQGAIEVDLALVLLPLRMAAGQPKLGPLAGALGPREVDLLGRLGHLGEDDHAVGLHFRESARHQEVLLGPAGAVGHLAAAERGEQRRVPGQDAEIALHPGRDDLVHVGGDQHPARRRELEVHYVASRIFFAFSWASSMAPTM